MVKKVVLAITIVAVLAVGSLALAACGTKATTTTTMAPATTMAPTTTMATATKDIVDTAVAAGSFKTLASLLTAAGLVDTLKGPGPFTVFAPTDAAFAAVPKATLDALAADPKGALTKVLTYHVLSGKVMAADVTDGLMAKTLEGDSLKFAVAGGKVTVNGANVVTADIVCSNGVIHVIDAVLLPPGM